MRAGVISIELLTITPSVLTKMGCGVLRFNRFRHNGGTINVINASATTIPDCANSIYDQSEPNFDKPELYYDENVADFIIITDTIQKRATV